MILVIVDGIGKGKKSVGIEWLVFEGTAIAGVRVGVEVLLYGLPGAGKRG